MNSQPLDPQFRTLHPATALWWEQRKQCEGCKHLDAQPDPGLQSSDQIVMRCKLTPTRETEVFAYCIDARLPGAPCGPGARLYELRVL